jgi:hypothetical protein
MVLESINEPVATETPLPAAEAPETPVTPEAPEPVVAEQPPSDGEPSETPVEIDWQARAQKAEGQYASLTKTLADERAGAETLNSLADTISAMKFQIAADGLSTQAALKVVQTGNEEDISAAWAGGQQAAIDNAADVTMKAEYAGLRAEAETLKSDSAFAAAFVEQVTEINAGNVHDLGGLRVLVAEARGRSHTAEIDALKAQVAERDEKFNGARAAFEKEYEVHQTNSGPASSGNGTTGTLATAENIDVLFNQDPDKYENQYRQFLRTGKIS